MGCMRRIRFFSRIDFGMFCIVPDGGLLHPAFFLTCADTGDFQARNGHRSNECRIENPKRQQQCIVLWR